MLFCGLIGLNLGLLFFASWKPYILCSLGSAIGWLALGLVWVGNPETLAIDSTEDWVGYLGYVFILMTVVPLMLHVRAYRSSKPTPKTSQMRAAEYRERLRKRMR